MKTSQLNLFVVRASLGLMAMSIHCVLSGCSSSPDFWEQIPESRWHIDEGDRFEVIVPGVFGSDSGTSLFVGLIPLSDPTFEEAAEDAIRNAGYDPEDPTIALYDVEFRHHWMSYFFLDIDRLNIIAKIVRRLDPSPKNRP